VSGDVRKNQEMPGTKSQEAKKLGKGFVPKNHRISSPIFNSLIKLSTVRTKLYLFTLADRRVPKRQGYSRVATFPLRTKTKLSHIVQVTGAHRQVVLKPRAFVPVVVRASQSSIFLSMLVVAIITTLDNRYPGSNRSRGENSSSLRWHVLSGSDILLA
jgi:hypothetical protein